MLIMQTLTLMAAMILAGLLPHGAAVTTCPQSINHGLTDPTIADRTRVNRPNPSDARITTANTVQPSISPLQRLRHRYSIDDIDGIGEIINPLINNLIQPIPPAQSDLSISEQHLIAAAAVKFFVRRGQFSHAVVPFLIAKDRQQTLTKNAETGQIKFLDAKFQHSHLPPLFLSKAQRTQVHSEIKVALGNGLITQSSDVDRYLSPPQNSLSVEQQEMVAAIAAAQTANPIKDRQILKLIQHFVIHHNDHHYLTHQSLALAIDLLEQNQRHQEADRLRSVFRTHFPDSQRISQ